MRADPLALILQGNTLMQGILHLRLQCKISGKIIFTRVSHNVWWNSVFAVHYVTCFGTLEEFPRILSLAIWPKVRVWGLPSSLLPEWRDWKSHPPVLLKLLSFCRKLAIGTIFRARFLANLFIGEHCWKFSIIVFLEYFLFNFSRDYLSYVLRETAPTVNKELCVFSSIIYFQM